MLPIDNLRKISFFLVPTANAEIDPGRTVQEIDARVMPP